jgi:hypothetical protein
LELAINLITILARSGEETDLTEMAVATALESAAGTDGTGKRLLIGDRNSPARSERRF